MFTAIAGNPTVNYLKSYTQPNLTQTLLALDSAGTLWGETSPGVLSAPLAAGLISPGELRREFDVSIQPRIYRAAQRAIRRVPAVAIRRHEF